MASKKNKNKRLQQQDNTKEELMKALDTLTTVIGDIIVFIYILMIVILSVPFNLWALTKYYLDDCRKFKLTRWQAMKKLWNK